MNNQNETNTMNETVNTTATPNKDRKPAVFMSVQAFKDALGIKTLDVFVWDKDTKTRKASGKLSCQDEFGNIYRCQQNIDSSKPMAIILEKGKPIEEACLINTTKGESAFTFKFSAK
jgi:hypothetical protein